MGATPDKDGKQQTTLYDWDGRDRLRRILRPDGVQLNYSYDAFGRRVHKIRRAADGALSNNNFVWDGEVLAAELDDQRGPRAFVHEPGGFEPILQQQGGETFLCVNDHLGMPKDLVSGDGLVVWTAAHSAYGRVIAVDADLAAKARYGESASSTAGARGTATAIESPFRLLGQVADEDAELGWTRFRCFDTESGRWLSPDPWGIYGGSNLLGLDGSPTDVVDPRGLNVDQKAHPPATAHEELKAIGPIQGKTKADIKQDLAARGFTPVPSKDGTGEVWTKPMPDGNTAAVRLDEAKVRPTPKGFADEVPHAHKEIVPTTDVKNGNYDVKATSLDDSGNTLGGSQADKRAAHIPIS